MPTHINPAPITVTVDINERITFSWGNPTISLTTGEADAGTILIEGIWSAQLKDDGKTLMQVYGRQGAVVHTAGEVFLAMLAADVVRVLPPLHFHSARRRSRVCVRRDGLEIPLLDVIGAYLAVPDPSWRRRCWDERFANVVSLRVQPVAGSEEYHKEYRAKTSFDRREKARKARETSAAEVAALQAAHETAMSIVSAKPTVDDLIRLAKGDGGGGPRHSDAKRQASIEEILRDLGHGDGSR